MKGIQLLITLGNNIPNMSHMEFKEEFKKT